MGGPKRSQRKAKQGPQLATFGAGCFWGVEAVYERLYGVLDVVSGYSGGSEDTAEYYTVGTGTTGHTESVQIVYDPKIIGYEMLLEVFFNVAHDPTQLNYQGPDIGPQYRSVAERYIEELDADGIFSKPIVTQVVPLEAFYLAEVYHQDFMQLNPQHPYIVCWDLPKIVHLEKAYPELLAKP